MAGELVVGFTIGGSSKSNESTQRLSGLHKKARRRRLSQENKFVGNSDRSETITTSERGSKSIKRKKKISIGGY